MSSDNMKNKYKKEISRSSRIKDIRERIEAPEGTPQAECITARELFDMCWKRGYRVGDIVRAIGGDRADWNNWIRKMKNILRKPFDDMLEKPEVRPSYGYGLKKMRKYDDDNAMIVRREYRERNIVQERIAARHETITALKRIKYLLSKKKLDEDLRVVLTGSRRRLEKAVKEIEGFMNGKQA